MRLSYLDSCRGFTMLLVVLYHYMEIIPSGFLVDVSIHLCAVFRMPLMFFVSGFLMYKSNYSMGLLRSKGRIRIVSQLYPTLIIGAIVTYIRFPMEWPDGLITHPLKGGYWFTIALVEMFFIAAPMLYIFSKYSVKKLPRALCFLGIGTLATLCYLKADSTTGILGNFYGATSLILVERYLPFFILGLIAKMYESQYRDILTNKYLIICALIVFLFVPLKNQDILWGKAFGQPLTILCSICGVMVVLHLFLQLERMKLSLVNNLRASLTTVGKYTLEIYLLHYVFIHLVTETFGFKNLEYPLNACDGFPFFILLSISTVLGCLAIVKVLKLTGLYMFVFPKKEDVARLGALLKFSKPAEN